MLLFLNEKLQNGELISLEECCSNYKISIPTFRRYLSTLREFFWEEFEQEVKYFSAKKAYGLVKGAVKKNA